MFSLAFICTANMCRSVMAHAICAHEIAIRGGLADVYSAGTMNFTGEPPAFRAWVACCQNGPPPQKEGSTFVRDLPLSSIGRFFVMEQRHAAILTGEYEVSPARISLLGSFNPKSKAPEIEDPINQGAVEFDRCYSRIRRCVLAYLDNITEIPGLANGALKGTENED